MPLRRSTPHAKPPANAIVHVSLATASRWSRDAGVWAQLTLPQATELAKVTRVSKKPRARSWWRRSVSLRANIPWSEPSPFGNLFRPGHGQGRAGGGPRMTDVDDLLLAANRGDRKARAELFDSCTPISSGSRTRGCARDARTAISFGRSCTRAHQAGRAGRRCAAQPPGVLLLHRSGDARGLDLFRERGARKARRRVSW